MCQHKCNYEKSRQSASGAAISKPERTSSDDSVRNRPSPCLLFTVLLLTAGLVVGMLSGCATPSKAAATRGDTGTIQDQGSTYAIFSSILRGGMTDLAWAAANGQTDTVQALLAKGADVNEKTIAGQTALMLAAANGHTATVQALLAKGADVNVKDEDDETALMMAKHHGYTAIVQALTAAAATTAHNPPAQAVPEFPPIDVDRLPSATGTVGQVEKAEQAAHAAVTGGRYREALKDYLAAWEMTGSNIPWETANRIHEQIIKVARRLDPPPALPEDARRHMVVGTNLSGEAKGPDGFARARDQFEQAARLAPWAGDIYFNLGTVSEKLNDYSGALRCYKLYLLASPNAADARAVKDKIYVLEDKAGVASRTPNR